MNDRYFVAMAMLIFKLTDHYYPESPEMIERQIAWALASYDQYTPEARPTFVAQFKDRLARVSRARASYMSA
jgi:3-methyladenine DNA glycosylase AlkD